MGHAVRANYMYSGMADVAALTGDERFVEAIDRLWNNVVSKKLYITGGVGATGDGEAYGKNYELPNLSAYCETCANIANCYWNQRMFLLHGECEIHRRLRTLLVQRRDLRRFARRQDRFSTSIRWNPTAACERSAWFGCACCPPNICRFLASLPGYVYAVRGDELYANLYVGGKATVKIGDSKVNIVQETRYPWDGEIKIHDRSRASRTAFCVEAPHSRLGAENARAERFVRLSLEKSTAVADAQGQRHGSKNSNWRTAMRCWIASGSRAMSWSCICRCPCAACSATRTSPKIAAKWRLQRGPLVYCIEHPDVPDGKVLESHAAGRCDRLKSTFRADLLGGVEVITGKAMSLQYAE